MTEPETSRSEFEKWARDKVLSIKIDPEDNEYIWIDTQSAWVAWQAAREALTAVTKQRDMCQEQASYFCEQWEKALLEQLEKALERMLNAERGLLNSNKRGFTSPYINETNGQ